MTVDQMVDSIWRTYGGAWWALFHEDGAGFRFLPTGEHVTAADYQHIRRRFTAEPRGLTPDEIRRNRLRGIADAADEGGRRRGR